MRTRPLVIAGTIVVIASVAATAGAALGSRFTDVPASHPFVAEIEAMADACVVNGYADGTFRPGANVSRQALSAMLARGLPALVHDASNDVELDVGAEADLASVTIEVSGGPACKRHLRIDTEMIGWRAGEPYACEGLADALPMSTVTIDGVPVNGASPQNRATSAVFTTVGPGSHTIALHTAVNDADGACSGKIRLWAQLAVEVFAQGRTEPIVYPAQP